MMKSEQFSQKLVALDHALEDKNKDAIAMTTRMGALERLLHTVNARHQAASGEIEKFRQLITTTGKEISNRDAIISALESNKDADIAKIKHEEEERRSQILQRHAQKIALLQSQLASTQATINFQQSALQKKVTKERDLLKSFGDKISALISEDVMITNQTMPLNQHRVPRSIKPQNSMMLSEEPMLVPPRPPEAVAFNVASDDAAVDTADFFKIEDPTTQLSIFPQFSKIDEMLPIIESAFDHGDTEDQIRSSLSSSGYAEEEIDEAIAHYNSNKFSDEDSNIFNS
jgi:cellobiose-specific phosphotransferase system component IIA